MTEDEIEKLLRNPEKTFDVLIAMPKSARRKLGPSVLRIEKRAWSNFMKDGGFNLNHDAVNTALIATCTLSQLKRLRYQPFVDDIVNLLTSFEIEFIAEWVDLSLSTNPHSGKRLSEIWQSGLCPRPQSEAFVLSYYATGRLFDWNNGEDARLEMDDAFFESDVWRFFEVEGGGEYSLAAHDKYQQEHRTWTTRLLEYVENNKLDRARVLDASLDALSRDFAQFRASWYSRFHEVLNPTLEERSERLGAYLDLLSSSIPPTVGFALKAIKKINAATSIAPETLMTALEVPLQARQKSHVLSALQLLTSVGKKHPDKTSEVARIVCSALVSEDVGVQEKAIALIERLDGLNDPNVYGAFEIYLPHLAPSIQKRFTDVAPISSIEPEPIRRQMPEPFEPVKTQDEALATILQILEDSSDPFQVERAFDGMARFGAALLGDEKAMSPLRKRSTQIWKKLWGHEIDFIALAARIWCEKSSEDDILSEQQKHSYRGYHDYQFHLRNADILDLISENHALPMLSMPTDTGGFIDPAVLKDRLAAYRAAGAKPGQNDLSIALLRLSGEGGPELTKEITPDESEERALAYALGGHAQLDEDTAFFTSALEIRQLRDARFDPNSELVDFFDVVMQGDEQSAWFEVNRPPKRTYVQLSEAIDKRDDASWIYTSKSTSPWQSLLCPGFMEAYYRNVLIGEDPDYGGDPKRLLPFFRPGPGTGPLGAAVLVLYLAHPQKEIRLLAADAVVALIGEGRLDDKLFCETFNSILFNFHRPTGRWIDSLSTVAETSTLGAIFVSKAIAGSMIFPPDQPPKNYGGLLEVLYEKCLPNCSFELNEADQELLSKVKGGGKLAKYAKRLISKAA